MAKGSHKKTVKQIASLNDPLARRRLCNSIAVLPVGSMEQHGGHLPVSADSDIAVEVSERVCAITGYSLLPPVSYGVSFEHSPRLNLSVRGTTLRHLITDIAGSLADAGARGLVIINAHHGNQIHLDRLSEKIRGHAGAKTIRCIAVPYWKFMSTPFDHAGHVETSIMLACGSVNMRAAKKGFIEPDPITRAAHRELSRRASVSFMSVAKNGVWGDPRLATRAKGTKLLDEIAINIAAKCKTEMRATRLSRHRRA